MPPDRAEEIIHAVLAKLEANRDLLLKSLRFGRVTWRLERDGKLRVDLDLKV